MCYRAVCDGGGSRCAARSLGPVAVAGLKVCFPFAELYP